MDVLFPVVAEEIGQGEGRARRRPKKTNTKRKAQKRAISSGRRYPLRWIKDHGRKKSYCYMGPEAIVIRGVMVVSISLGHYVSGWAAVDFCFKSSMSYLALSTKRRGF